MAPKKTACAAAVGEAVEGFDSERKTLHRVVEARRSHQNQFFAFGQPHVGAVAARDDIEFVDGEGIRYHLHEAALHHRAFGTFALQP